MENKMNKRIRELAKKSGFSLDSTEIYTAKLEHLPITENMEKFAELIIREYEQFLPEVCPWAKADEPGPMKGWHVQFVARKHFGVEV